MAGWAPATVCRSSCACWRWSICWRARRWAARFVACATRRRRTAPAAAARRGHRAADRRMRASTRGGFRARLGPLATDFTLEAAGGPAPGRRPLMNRPPPSARHHARVAAARQLLAAAADRSARAAPTRPNARRLPAPRRGRLCPPEPRPDVQIDNSSTPYSADAPTPAIPNARTVLAVRATSRWCDDCVRNTGWKQIATTPSHRSQRQP